MPLVVALPLAGGFLAPALGRVTGSGRWAAALPLAVAAAVLVLVLAMQGRGDEAAVLWMGGWKFPVGISLYADGLTRLVLLVIAVIGLLALVFSMDYMRQYTSPSLYYGLFLLMLAGMNGVVISGDLFNIFVFVEIAGLASYALVAFGTEADELEASLKYLALGAVASTFILVGIAIVYNVTGQLNWAKIAQAVQGAGGPSLPLAVALAFFLMGFGLKAAMVPFHAWLPDAHPAAPAPISAMLSGVLIKACGVYAVARIVFSVFGATETFGWVLAVMGVASMALGSLLMLVQADFKRLLAYSSIGQMGYVVLALGAAAVMQARGVSEAVVALAVFGGLFHLVNHAIFKSLLFLCSGSVEYATGTRQLKELGGLGARMPVTGACLRVAALSISGVPPLNGFWSKLVIILALVLGGFYTLAAIAAAVSVVTLVSFARVQRYVLGGAATAAAERAREVPAGMGLATVALATLCVASSLVMLPSVRGVLVDPAVRVVQAGLGRRAPQAAPVADVARPACPAVSGAGAPEPRLDKPAVPHPVPPAE